MKLQYHNTNEVFLECEKHGVEYLEFAPFAKLDVVKHGFSTRIGGVSTGIYGSMNLSFARGDEKESVQENFRRMTKAIGTTTDHLVFSAQTHTTNIKTVTQADQGKGFVYPVDYEEVDGLITNEPGVCLVTFFADCVPLFLVDPVKKAIGLVHSGWRGTAGKIGAKAIAKMEEEFGCEPRNIYAAVGPSICQSCYEVSEDVADQFREAFAKSYWETIFYRKENGKYQLDLWKANDIIFTEAGITKDHLSITNVCTCCNHESLFSHRASQGKRGNLAAFLELK